jgi:hypothetical protein
VVERGEESVSVALVEFLESDHRRLHAWTIPKQAEGPELSAGAFASLAYVSEGGLERTEGPLGPLGIALCTDNSATYWTLRDPVLFPWEQEAQSPSYSQVAPVMREDAAEAVAKLVRSAGV